MKFGLSANKIDEIGVVSHAENLGYDFCWVTDSPMLRSEPFAVLALAAQQTRTIRLGTGVAVPGLRLAPVAANGMATINRLAPGRCFMGLGTGNTAMRTLGHKPATVKAFAEYIRVVRALLRGEEVDFTHRGVTHPIRFENLHYRYIDVEHPIPIHVGGFGPRAQALGGELGDGLITSIPRGGRIPEALANVRRGAETAGRSLDGFETFALVNLLMLEPGETLESDRAKAVAGPAVMTNVHFVAERYRESGAEPPDYVLPIWDEYLDFLRKRDSERRHQQMHGSHYSHLDPDEARFVTPDMIRRFCIAGQPEEIVEQIRDLERQGLTGMSFIPPFEQQYRMIEDFARKVMARL